MCLATDLRACSEQPWRLQIFGDEDAARINKSILPYDISQLRGESQKMELGRSCIYDHCLVAC